MWALVKADQVIRVFNGAKAFEHNDIKHPASIFNCWSTEEKAAIGLYPIVDDNSNYKNTDYYNNKGETFTFDSSKKIVKKTWGTAKSKSLTDVKVVDAKGEKVLDSDGNQMIQKGLKTLKKEQVKNEASSLLEPTDWYVIKATELSDYTVPSSITKYRAAIRTKSNAMETAIDNASDADALEKLYAYVNTGTTSKPVMARPLGEFPKLEDF